MVSAPRGCAGDERRSLETDYNFDWAATATIVGYAMFYGVTPGNYTVKATAAGYSMSTESFTDIPVNAGEVIIDSR